MKTEKYVGIYNTYSLKLGLKLLILFEITFFKEKGNGNAKGSL